MATTSKKSSSKKPSKTIDAYQSNPFSLAFNKFGLFFENNLGWGIALIVIPLLYGLIQLGSHIPTLLENDSSQTTTSSFGEKGDRNYRYNNSNDIKNNRNEDFKEPHIDQKDLPAVGFFVFIIFLVVITIVASLIMLQILITTFIFGALTYVALENDAGRKASLSSAIDAVVARFRRLFLATLLADLKIFGWTLLFIIPGIIATFRYALLPFVIMDESPKKRGIISSHDRVKQIVSGRKREVFGVAIVAVIIPIVSPITQLVGNAALYRQLKSYYDQGIEKPPVHWLNYFGLFLIGIYLLFVVALVALIATTDIATS